MSSIPGDFAINGCRCADSECKHRQETILELPKKKEDRVKGQLYMKNGDTVIWNGIGFHCEHGKQKSRCKQCGGSGLCEHGKRKSRCKQCGGSSICEHGKRKSQCKQCGGSSICEHGRMKSTCKECGGSQICEHGRIKSQCKQCGGSQICKHGRIKSECKECGGSRFCEHGKRKSHCKECGGSQICKHGRMKSACKECEGSQICEHRRMKSACKECGGSQICKHGKRKSYCKECGGSSFCEHGREKSRCKECGGSSLCKNRFCETRARSKYDGYCMPCFINNPLNANKPAHRNYKTKEKEVALAITKIYPDATWILDKRIQDGCSARRPDVLLDLGYHVLMIEVDENRHDNYDCSCENKRLMLLSQDLGHRNMVVIRFNPDAYETSQGEKVPSCWKLNKRGVVHIPKDQQNTWNNRIQQLLDTIQYWIENESEKQIEMVELFYG
jgi:hypothetical protein